jgi:pimeloyl-ACP methyl ester carboxylesterase
LTQALRNDGQEPVPVSFEGHGGITIRGDAWGDPDARPVVLLHGGGQTRHSWSRCGRRLAEEGWRAVSLDLRGHGESDWCPESRYAPSDFVGDILAVARALPAPPVLVGASLGGMTALLAVGESPEPVAAGLVLVDVTPRLEIAGTARIVDFMLARPEGFATLEEAADAVAAYRSHRSRPTDLSGLRKNLRLGPDGRWRWHWDPRFVDRRRIDAIGGIRGAARGGAFNEPERLLKAARALAVPTLLVRGRESDVVSPEGAQEFLDAAPHARFVDVSGAGHMVAGDRNDAFNEAVLAFLREIAG